MSVVTYDAGQMLLTIDDTGVERALGSLYRKTPAVLKVAINRTARQARKDLIAEAEKRYAPALCWEDAPMRFTSYAFSTLPAAFLHLGFPVLVVVLLVEESKSLWANIR